LIFCLKSLRIKDSLQYIIEISCQNKKNQAFIAFSEILKKIKRNRENCEENLRIKEVIADYGTSNEKNQEKNSDNPTKIKAIDIPLNIYTSIYEKQGFYHYFLLFSDKISDFY